jgi:hypothetical protein
MRRIFYILLIICTFNINVSGSNKNVKGQNGLSEGDFKLTYGAEWSYIGSIHYSSKFNFYDSEGYRENRSESRYGYWNNGEALLHIGYNLNTNWNLSLYTGIIGLDDFHNAIPLSLRATYCFGDSAATDRWISFADVGTGLSLKQQPQEILTGKVGGGYRLSLSRDSKLDFIAALRLAYTHPKVIDGNDVIPLESVNRNTALIKSFSFGMSITF